MSLLTKIKFKFKGPIISSLIKISLFFNWPWLTAIVFWLASGKVNPEISSQYTVLYLGRSIFTEDIYAMAKLSGLIIYVTIHRHFFKKLFYHFVKGKEQPDLGEDNYHTTDLCRSGRDKYKEFLIKMVPHLQKLIGFNAILACNFGYVEQQELAKVCEYFKLPFIVLNKEGIVIPTAYDDFVSQFKGRKFIGAKMLCYNNLIKDALLNLGIPGLSEAKTEVVGVPRLDFYFAQEAKIKSSDQKQITLFSFFPEDKFNYIKLSDEQKQKINQISKEFHRLIMNFALKRGDIKVIIKTKAPNHYVDYVARILKENFKNNIPNLIITNVGDPFELVQNSQAIAGFNSTTLVEAIIARKIIISPYFGDVIKDRDWDYFKGYRELVNYIKDEGDLEEYILNKEKYLQYDIKKRNEFLQRFIYMPDGKASQRAENAIIKIIGEQKNIS